MLIQRKLILKLITIMLIVAANLLTNSQVWAQEGIAVENAKVAVDYGKSITFQANIKTPLPIKQASILFRGANEQVTRVETIQVAEDGSVSFTYDASLNVFPPFSTILFWFQATLTDDQTYTSSPISFLYNDNRFPWRDTNRSNISVHWYAGDDSFGAAALDAATAGLQKINEIIPTSLENPVDIYIYSNVEDLKGALALGGQEWTAGHANPELGVVLVAIEPSETQSIEMQTKIPHELAHVMLYRSLADGYIHQPAWLLEGFASMMELYPNPDYAQALQAASQSDSLLSFEDLCASFPADAGNAFLAYAQSQSFVTYLRSTYGNSGLARLTDAYRDGFNCELGATNALGKPLNRLDLEWREAVLGQNRIVTAIRNLAPFAFFMALVLIVPILGAIDIVRIRRKRDQKPK